MRVTNEIVTAKMGVTNQIVTQWCALGDVSKQLACSCLKYIRVVCVGENKCLYMNVYTCLYNTVNVRGLA